MDRLLVAVLGERNSGKSRTWNTLFGKKTRTSIDQRPLVVANGEFVNVFLVSGSPQERKEYIEDLLTDKTARIILCSVQYKDDFKYGARETFNYFIKRKFKLYVQWLNPGYKEDLSRYPDHLGLFNYLQYQRSIVSIRDGKKRPDSRVREIREFIHGWAASRKLTYQKEEMIK